MSLYLFHTFDQMFIVLLKALLKTSNEPRTNWPECGNVDLTSYSVRYREGRECVLKGIDVSIKAGEKVTKC